MNSVDISDDQIEVCDRRVTRVISPEEVILDESNASQTESDISYTEENSLVVPNSNPQISSDTCRELQGMSAEQVNELLSQLNIEDEENNEVNKTLEACEEGGINQVQEKQYEKKTQKAQAKKAGNEVTKSNKNHKEAKNTKENKTNNPIEVKGKKVLTITNVYAQSEEDLNKLETESKMKKPETLPRNVKNNENLVSKKKIKDTDFQEKKAANNKNEKTDNKKHKSKPSKPVGNENLLKESETNSLPIEVNDVSGRVTRSTRANSVLKEVCEPVQNPDGETVGRGKKNVKKLQPKTKTTEENLDFTNKNDETTTGQKKKTSKKLAAETNKLPITNEDVPATHGKRTEKTSRPEVKELEKNPLATIQENSQTSRSRKNGKKDISDSVHNTGQKEQDTAVKNKKAKNIPKNIQETEIDKEPPSDLVGTQKAKLKQKSNVKNTKLSENKENTSNENSIPHKRTARKK